MSYLCLFSFLFLPFLALLVVPPTDAAPRVRDGRCDGLPPGHFGPRHQTCDGTLRRQAGCALNGRNAPPPPPVARPPQHQNRPNPTPVPATHHDDKYLRVLSHNISCRLLTTFALVSGYQSYNSYSSDWVSSVRRDVTSFTLSRRRRFDCDHADNGKGANFSGHFCDDLLKASLRINTFYIKILIIQRKIFTP